MTLHRTPSGAYAEPPGPTHCPAGHALRPPNVNVGWRNCPCASTEAGAGHRTHTCMTCKAITYRPAHDESAAQT